ncbi:hypothetical protein EJB05_03250 [Eragrostis curvula]|uniref:Uncharacterized protein n=1 Tax=Eragrostis curvula TaxID=38414 RepID=A0A5J9WVW4_9POAL|nr:hypothetical protein EJB05_03250 [Eragrostis curvula]
MDLCATARRKTKGHKAAPAFSSPTQQPLLLRPLCLLLRLYVASLVFMKQVQKSIVTLDYFKSTRGRVV